MSNDNKDLGGKSENDGTFREGDGLTPCNRIATSTEDPLEVFEEIQKWRGYITDNRNMDDDEVTAHAKQVGWPSQAYPTGIRKLLRKNPDYRPGPVKHYTQAEIEEYEKWRST